MSPRPSSARADGPNFRPFPLLGNAHVQTLLGHWLRGKRCPPPDRQRVVRLPDGDGLLVYDNAAPGWRPGDPVALVVHGLTGSHASPHVQRLAARLLARGARVARMDLRGTGQGLALARGVYHGGRSDDVRAALEEVASWAPASPLLLVGVSLGGNLALKMAGEAADRPVPALARVAAVAPPIDLARCAALLARRRNRIYERKFVRELVREALQRQRLYPDLPAVAFPRRMTVRLFDDLYTAPRAGFADAPDYYARASAAPLVPRIAVPALVVTARDDPFIAVEPFEELRAPAHVEVQVLPKGGHVGFLGWDGAGGIRWAERRVVEWLLEG